MVTYYVGTTIGGVVLGLLDAFLDLGIDWKNTLILSVIALPFGIATCYLFYYLLEKSWSKRENKVELSINDIGKSEEDL